MKLGTGTCIVGLRENGKVYLGGDSMGSNGRTFRVYKRRKVVRINGEGTALIGYCGSFRLGQLAQYYFQVPKHPASMSNMEFMVTKFVPMVKRVFSKQYTKEWWKEKELDFRIFLIAYRKGLFGLSGHELQVDEVAHVYDAIGSGLVAASGAMEVLLPMKIPPEQKVKRALEAAGKIVLSVGAPYYVEKL